MPERTSKRRTYNTRQRQEVMGFIESHADRYLSVDELFGLMRGEGSTVGRTTTYRALESLVASGSVAKVVAPGGGESRYRLIDPSRPDEGQMVCLSCGKVFPLDCDMLLRLVSHVRSEHGFAIEQSRTVLYGYCDVCAEATRG